MNTCCSVIHIATIYSSKITNQHTAVYFWTLRLTRCMIYTPLCPGWTSSSASLMRFRGRGTWCSRLCQVTSHLLLYSRSWFGPCGCHGSNALFVVMACRHKHVTLKIASHWFLFICNVFALYTFNFVLMPRTPVNVWLSLASTTILLFCAGLHFHWKYPHFVILF